MNEPTAEAASSEDVSNVSSTTVSLEDFRNVMLQILDSPKWKKIIKITIYILTLLVTVSSLIVSFIQFKKVESFEIPTIPTLPPLPPLSNTAGDS